MQSNIINKLSSSRELLVPHVGPTLMQQGGEAGSHTTNHRANRRLNAPPLPWPLTCQL